MEKSVGMMEERVGRRGDGVKSKEILNSQGPI